MSKKSFLKFLFLLFLVLSFLSFGQFVLADACLEGQTQSCGTCGAQVCECHEEEVEEIIVIVCDWGDCEETPKPDEDETDHWTEYRCQGNECGEEYIEKRSCEEECTRNCNCIGEGKWKCTKWNCDVSCDDPVLVGECDLPWQLCSDDNNWDKTKPSCDCAGECLETPKNPRYYFQPDYPTDPFEPETSENANNIFLPVKLDWDDVEAWKGGWKENEEIKTCSEDCVKSYRINIKNTNGSFPVIVSKSEYNPKEDQGSCTLKSDFSHDWEVQACCKANGTNCSSRTNWSFTTNGAPELVSPFDSDWSGQAIAENISPEDVTLDWCDVKDALSYRARIYYIDKATGNEICHPWLVSGPSCGSKLIRAEIRPPPYPPVKKLYSEFKDDEGFFAIDTEYRWQAASCFRADGSDCSDFGQKWGLKTASTTLPTLTLLSPPDDPGGIRAIGLPVILKWKPLPGMNSFIYDVYKENPGEISGWLTQDQQSLNFPTLKLNTSYIWKIKPCSDFEAKECGDWTEEWHFKITGAPPGLIYPGIDVSDVVIPVTFDWEDVSGAGSYKYEVASDWLFTITAAEGIVESSYVSVDYPGLKMLTDYWWRVKTCADKEGQVCGDWSETRKFKTFKLGAPSNPYPPDKGTLFTYEKYISWGSVPGAKRYIYTIDYALANPPPEEKSKDCIALAGTKIVPLTIVPSNSAYVDLRCLGKYNWRVQACLDENCNELGDSGPVWEFDLIQPPPGFGLVPCGRVSDDPDTPWNERDPCQIKHLFILFKIIIDFLLWRIGLIILVLLVIATGVIFYFSLGAPTTMGKVKSLWKAASIGYAVLFLSWIIINSFLAMFGYRIGIFGRWWEIIF